MRGMMEDDLLLPISQDSNASLLRSNSFSGFADAIEVLLSPPTLENNEGQQVMENPSTQREMALSDLQGLFSDDVSQFINCMAADALSSNATRMNFGIVPLSVPATTPQLLQTAASWQADDVFGSLMNGLNQSILRTSFAPISPTADDTSDVSLTTPPPADTSEPTISMDSIGPSSNARHAGRRKSTSGGSSTGNSSRSRKRRQSSESLGDESEEKSYSRSQSLDSTEQEALSKREKNILACRKARQKKREKIESMEEKVAKLEEKNKELERKLKAVIKTAPELKEALKEPAVVREERAALLRHMYHLMNIGRLEEAATSLFHPTCVMIKPAQESIGCTNMWRSWMEMEERFLVKKWNIHKMEALDPRGNKFRCEWSFRGVLRPGAAERQGFFKHACTFLLANDTECSQPPEKALSNYLKVESRGRSYFVFTPENQLVFCNHEVTPHNVKVLEEKPTHEQAQRLLLENITSED